MNIVKLKDGIGAVGAHSSGLSDNRRGFGYNPVDEALGVVPGDPRRGAGAEDHPAQEIFFFGKKLDKSGDPVGDNLLHYALALGKGDVEVVGDERAELLDDRILFFLDLFDRNYEAIF